MKDASKKITIDGLARMIKKSFDDVQQRFNKTDLRLERIEKKLEGIVYKREFEGLEMRVKFIEEALAIKSSK